MTASERRWTVFFFPTFIKYFTTGRRESSKQQPHRVSLQGALPTDARCRRPRCHHPGGLPAHPVQLAQVVVFSPAGEKCNLVTLCANDFAGSLARGRREVSRRANADPFTVSPMESPSFLRLVKSKRDLACSDCVKHVQGAQQFEWATFFTLLPRVGILVEELEFWWRKRHVRGRPHRLLGQRL